jgi:hypothetical protein
MKHGGRRPGAGRPQGAKDRFFRGKEHRVGVKEALQEAETFLRTNGAAIFEGDSVAFLMTIYKNENLPLNIRQNAAVAASSFERPRMSDNRVLLLESRAKEQSEEERRRLIAEGDQRLDDLIATFEHFVADRESEILGLLESGEITPKAAEAIRSWHLKPELPLLPPPSPPCAPYHETSPEPHRSPLASETPPLSDTAKPKSPNSQCAPLPRIDPRPAPWLSGALDKPIPPPGAAIVLFTEPHRNFWIGGIGAISANEDGEIAADAATASQLINAGCRPTR